MEIKDVRVDETVDNNLLKYAEAIEKSVQNNNLLSGTVTIQTITKDEEFPDSSVIFSKSGTEKTENGLKITGTNISNTIIFSNKISEMTQAFFGDKFSLQTIKVEDKFVCIAFENR